MMREGVTRRECDDGGMCDGLELGRSPRGFTAERLNLPSGTEFEQPNRWGWGDADSQRQPGSEGSSEGGRGVNLRDEGEKLRKCGNGSVCHVGV